MQISYCLENLVWKIEYDLNKAKIMYYMSLDVSVVWIAKKLKILVGYTCQQNITKIMKDIIRISMKFARNWPKVRRKNFSFSVFHSVIGVLSISPLYIPIAMFFLDEIPLSVTI